MIHPVKCKNTVELAIENIGNFIAQNLQEGDVLPSERDLAESLCISRNITREALQHFRTLGIIQSKPKVGAVVSRMTPGNVYKGFFPFIPVTDHSFQDLAHLRLTLELGCAEMAVKRVTPEDIDTLYALSEKIYRAATQKKNGDETLLSEQMNADMEFHTKMMLISGNRLMESLIPLVVEFFGKHFLRERSAATIKDREAGYQEHFKMVEALKNGNTEELTLLIRSHIKGYTAGYVQAKKNRD